MKIGIIGAGAIGTTLAKHLTEAGYEIVISNSRGADTLKEKLNKSVAKLSPVRCRKQPRPM